MKGGKRRGSEGRALFLPARVSVVSCLRLNSVAEISTYVSCAPSVGRSAGVSKVVPLDRSPDPDAEAGRAAEGAAEKMSAWRRQRRRRGRDGGGRILREGGVCLTVCVGFLLCLLGEVFLARRLRRRRRLLFHACSGEKEGKRMRNIAISIHIVCQSSLHWRYQRVS